MLFKNAKIIALMLVLVMTLGVVSGCTQQAPAEEPEEPATEAPEEPAEEPEEPAEEREIFQVAFGGSAPGGVYYYMIGVLANLLSEALPYVNVTNVSTGASVANAIGVAKGELHMGFTYGSLVYEIWNGIDTFKDQPDIGENVRGVAKAYASPHYFVTLEGSGIETASDLAGKTVSVGPPGSGAQYNSDLILNALGIEVEREYLAFADASYAIKEGRIDAFGQSGAPSGAITELAETENIVIIPFSDAEMDTLEAASQFYYRNNLPKEVYKGMTEDVQMPFFSVYWIAHKDVPDEVVYDMVKEAFQPDTMTELADGYVLWEELEEDSENFEELGPEIHPGAKQYFDEVN